MAYIGAEPLPGQNREVDDISSSFNGSTTAFTLQVNGLNVSPETANNIIVSVGGVIQNPGTDYTIAASTITFTTAPASGLDFFALILGAGINTATVADDTIGPSKLIDTAVTAGSYTTADITVDAQGRITAAASGTISGAEIADQAVTNAKVNNSAAIAVSKLANFVTNNADNRVITGSGTTNTLNGEADLTFDGNDLTINKTGGDSDVIIKTTTSGNPVLKFNASGAGGHEIAFDRSDTALTFTTTGSSERMRIDSSGRLLINTNSSINSDGFQTHLQIAGTSSQNSSAYLARFSDNASAPFLILAKSRNGTVGSNTVVQAGDDLGVVLFHGNDGSGFHEGARISAVVESGVGNNDLPTSLTFKTNSGSTSVTEKMRLGSNGVLGIGTTSPRDQTGIHLSKGGGECILELQRNQTNTTGNVGIINFTASDGHSVANMGAFGDGDNEGAYISFKTTSAASDNSPFGTNTTEALRINSDQSINAQKVYDNTTSSGANVNVHTDGHLRRSTSSRRYKNTITDATHGLTELLKLKSVTFKGNEDGDTVFGGLIAEDVHDSGLTEFVHYDKDNEPDALAYGNMVALCVKAIQELTARVATLESA